MDSNKIHVVSRELNLETRRKERVESLDEGTMTTEQGRNTLDDAGGVDAKAHKGKNTLPMSREKSQQALVADLCDLKSFIMSKNWL